MGDFRIVIEAVGGHGCQRDVKDGGEVFGCQSMGCPDCQLSAFLRTLVLNGCSLEKATLTHWPADAPGRAGPDGKPTEYAAKTQVVDEFEVKGAPVYGLRKRVRHGSF